LIILFFIDFSKIVEYNAALQQPILTEKDEAFPEFRETLYKWDNHLNPEKRKYSSQEYLNKAKEGGILASLSMVHVAGAYRIQ